jgi:hypothetical protein
LKKSKIIFNYEILKKIKKNKKKILKSWKNEKLDLIKYKSKQI